MKQEKATGMLCRGAALVLAAWCGMTAFAGCAREQTQFVQLRSSVGQQSTTEAEADSQIPEAHSEKVEMIYVYVCGAVRNAGVYTLESGARVFAAIEAAGGFAEDAADESINQARVLADGEELYVPTREELLSSSAVVPENSRMGNTDKEQKVNINTADVSELMTITGIGESRARAIIAWREEHGGFSSTEELKNIDGIAEKTYEKIRDSITVN